MAQVVDDPMCVPVARNTPFSLFKGATYFGEGQKAMTTPTGKAAKTMKTTTTAPVTASEPTVTAPVTDESTLTATVIEPTAPVTADLATLVAARRELDAQIKAAKASRPQRSGLDRVVAAQLANPTKWLPLGLQGRVMARVKAGQPRAEAIDAVLAQYRTLLEVTTEADTEADAE